MLRLLPIIAIVVVIIIVLNNATTVRSWSRPRFCGYSNTYMCPDDHVQIKSPFWIENRTADEYGNCTSYPGFQVKCAANGRPVINLSNNLYYVLNIGRFEGGAGGDLSLMDVVMDAQECPQPQRNFSIASIRYLSSRGREIIFFYNCSRYPQNAVQQMPCLDNYYNNNSTGGRSFVFSDEEISNNQFDWYQNCEEAVVVPGEIIDDSANYTATLKRGFDLYWFNPVDCSDCELLGGNCEANKDITTPFHCNCPHNSICDTTHELGPSNRKKIVIGVSVGVGVGVGLLILLVIYRRNCYSLYDSTASCCRKKIKGPTNVEVFLKNNHRGLSLQNYKYSDIKKMTNSFKDTLGQGGYGSVFKGKLRDGQLIAVKVLNESKGKGEDFINEVATIGKTNHVNVVSLLGFCAEGTKRALVYEFMPNGSLDKFVHKAKDSSTTSSLLGWEKLYQIALGIARGLEYLHRGCNTRILHFDIKPHNILLNQDFCPKISDFGMAKLCPTKESSVSIVGARGTVGYIAPELCCANFGGVSHKSDVYSYGMMVLEMIGGRKNIDVTVENTSEIYFPQWIYKRLRENIKVEGSEKIEEVVVSEVVFEESAQKMIIVALWCIQAHPGDRPSMNKVVDMLEGNIKDLQLSPNPFPDPSSPFSSQ